MTLKHGSWIVAAFMTAFLLVGNLPLNISTSAQDSGSGLRVMSYNIKHGKGNDTCTDPTPVEGQIPETECAVDLARTADLIQSQNPDIVALQEVDRFWARSGGVDQPAELASMLGMEACYGPNLDHPADDHADEPHQYGVVILSKFPIASCTNTLLPTPEGWEQRGVLDARVTIDGGGEIAILDTHLQAGRKDFEDEAVRQRTEQAQAIADYLTTVDVPVVLMGDFNAEPGDPELVSLIDNSGLTDAWISGGDGTDGFTSPSNPDEPAQHRIDLVLLSDDWAVESAAVIVNDDTTITSDHYPVVVDLNPSTDATPIASPGAGSGDATPIVSTPVT